MGMKNHSPVAEKLRTIKPGVNYPTSVNVIEKHEGKTMNVNFGLCSYVTGMYCAIHINGQLANQTGDHNNKTFVGKLKRDLQKAIDRGAQVEIGSVLPIKTNATQ